jgi:hypothetical protein
MRQELRAGGVLDLLTKSELDESMGHHFDSVIRSWLRGEDYLSFVASGLGLQTINIPGPESGYTWSIKLLSINTNIAGQVVDVYAGSNTGLPPVGELTTSTSDNAVFTWSSNQLVIKDSAGITVTIGGGGGNVINGYHLRVKQVPTEMQGKL